MMSKTLRIILLQFAVLGLLAVNSFCAQIDPASASMDTMQLKDYFQNLADRLGERAWQRVDSKAKLDAERETMHKEFMFMIGLDPLPERGDLHATSVRTVELDEYTIEVLHYQSLPGFYVTANLYKPKKGKGPFPAVLWGPGHGNGEFGTKQKRQQHAAMWARAGYICIVVDPVQAAEIYGIHHGLAGYDLDEWYSRGYTPMAIEVWNAMRTVDYLLTRPDVDGDKLTLTGVSGGGHLSWMAGVADPRFAVVQPAAGTSQVPTHIRCNLYHMHCDCAYYPNTYQHDWTSMGALVAPRPLLLHCSTGDAYNPPEGYLNVLEKAKEAFSWYGKEDAAALSEVPGRHTYNVIQRERSVEFSTRWLLGREVDIKDREITPVEFSLLGALGGINAEHPDNINARVHEHILPAHQPTMPSGRAAWDTRRAEVMDKLQNVVLRNMPTGITPRIVGRTDGEDGYLLETEPGIKVGMYSHVPQQGGPMKAAVLYVASTGDSYSSSIWGFMKPWPLAEKQNSKHMVYPRGVGRVSWDRDRRIKYGRDAWILGRTMDDMRLADILCAVEAVATDPANEHIEELSLVGKGESGILAAYAALLDERVTRVVLHMPTESHLEGPHLLGVLRFTDIKETLAMLAPRCEVAIITHDIEDFALTRDIFKLVGVPEKFRDCVSITQALNLKD
jgi:cephalosporin-C deacetylase-like acetyl esterase